MAHRSILDLLHEGNYAPRDGRPIPIELIYQANYISHEQYRHELERQRRVAQAGQNSSAISDMELEAEILDQRAIRAGVPKRFLEYAIDVRHIDVLKQGRGIYIAGDQGTHKTTTACSMLRGWLKDNPFGVARFVRATTLMDDFNDTYSTRETMAEVMGQYSTVGLLLIDDLGKEACNARTVSRLWELIDRRYGSELPSIITSQFKPSELATHLSEGGDVKSALAIARRLAETFSLIDMGQA